MRNIVIIIGILLFVHDVAAQNLKKEEKIDGITYPVVIDHSTTPVKAKKTQAELKSQQESGTNSSMKPHYENDEINRKVSPRYAVSPTDVKKDGTKGSEAMTWEEAKAACAKYKGPSGAESEAGKWRLPTQREMLWIWIVGGTKGFSGYTGFTATKRWWCISEYSDNTEFAWAMYNNGSSMGYSKSTTYLVRCIRDLDPK